MINNSQHYTTQKSSDWRSRTQSKIGFLGASQGCVNFSPNVAPIVLLMYKPGDESFSVGHIWGKGQDC